MRSHNKVLFFRDTRFIFNKRIFFSRQSSQSKHEYSAVKTDGGNEKFKSENRIRSGAYLSCKRNLDHNERYELISQLGEIGFRADKNWYVILVLYF